MNILDVVLGPTFGKVIDKIFPDPALKQQAQLQLLQLHQAGEFKEIDAQLQINLAQSTTNTAEANSPSLLKGGWRPFIGWVCGVALLYDFLMQPLLSWASTAFWHCPIPPQLDIGTLITLVGGMLGLGGMRSAERINGVIPQGK